MKKLSKEQFLKRITQNAAYDISEKFAHESTATLQYTNFYPYTTGHYKLLYTLLKCKLDTLPDEITKTAYLDCLDVNFESLKNFPIHFLEFCIAFLSGSLFGVSFFELEGETAFKLVAFIFIVAFSLLRFCISYSKKWSFYNKVLSQLKKEIA